MGKAKFINITEPDFITQNGFVHIEHNDNSTTFRNIEFENISIITETIIINYENGSRTFPMRNHQDTKKTICFADCVFLNVNFLGDIKHNFMFIGCSFENLKFEQVSGSIDSTDAFYFDFCTFDRIDIINCFFKPRFYINPKHKDDKRNFTCKIAALNIQDTVFEKNFKLHECEIEHIELNNVDFEKNADFYLTQFIQKKPLKFKALNFRGLSLFGECVFNAKLILEYVTFEKLTHFREATFKMGIDLDKTNIEKDMNFYGTKGLDTKKSFENTSQETYRIIKNSFMKVGNTIESNKYHSLELEKKKIDLCSFSTFKSFRKFQEFLVFEVHYLVSGHSRHWILPLFWIAIVGFYTALAFDMTSISNYVNNAFKYMAIVDFDDSLKKMPWLYLLNKAILGYLYYQFVTSVRKDTRK